MKFKILICALLLACVLTGCVSRTKTEYGSSADTPGLMTVVDRTTGYAVYRHDETGVHYLCVMGTNGRAVCVMVNPDGTPYTGESEDLK